MGNTFFRVEYILYKYIATFNESICGVDRIGDQTWGYLLRGSKTGGWIGAGGVRPVLIIQNDIGNRHSPTVICAAITSRMNKAKLPTHIELNAVRYHMVKDSVILLEQLRTIDKVRLKDKICHLDSEIMEKVGKALRISLEL